MIVFLLILHMLFGVALIGGITHQAFAVLRSAGPRGQSFLAKYTAVNSRTFTNTMIILFVINVILGGVFLYPSYRLDVRIPLEEMNLKWAVGLFELKEHFGGLGLATLPLYAYYWKTDPDQPQALGRVAITWILAFIVWFDFIAGHIINNIRGL